jgi:hypothetical protein
MNLNRLKYSFLTPFIILMVVMTIYLISPKICVMVITLLISTYFNVLPTYLPMFPKFKTKFVIILIMLKIPPTRPPPVNKLLKFMYIPFFQ